MIAGAFGSKLYAQKDVTSQYITNAGFENCEAYTEDISGGDNVNRSIDYAECGWTNTSWASWSASAVVAARGTGTVGGVSAPSDGNGNMLGISVGWGGTVTYKTANVTLPKGYYLLKASAFNNNPDAAQFTSKLGFITTGDKSFLSTVGSFPYQSWTNDFVAFQITEDTEGYFQIGGLAVSGGSGANAKVFFDNLTLLYSEYPIDFTGKVGTAKANWTGAGGTTTGNKVALVELYNSSSSGTKMSQVVSVPNGLYQAELYATSHNARGENGATLNGTRDDFAYVFASFGEQTKKTYFTASGVTPGFLVNEPINCVISDIRVTDNKLTLGLGLEESSITGWHCIQIKSLFCVDPSIDGIATAFTNGSEAEGGKWYSYDILSDGEYTITAGSNLSNFVYTTDGTTLLSEADQLNTSFSATMSLTAGTYYFKSPTAQTLTFTPKSYSYLVGEGTSSIQDGSYVQTLTTWTIEFPNATTNDPSASFALIGNGKAQLKNGESVVAEGTLSLDGTTLTATFSDVTLDNDATYTLSLPTGVVGFEGQEVNEAVSITIHTPTVNDGIYYLYDAAAKLFLGRGANWGTEAVADKYGVPFNWKNGANETGSIEFIDWPGVYLFTTNDGGIYTDNASPGWKFVKATDGYYLCNADGSVYTTHELGSLGEYVHPTGSASAATVWTFMSKADHDAIVDAYPAANKTSVATAAGITGDFDTYIAKLTPIDKTSEIGTATFNGSAGDWTYTSVRNQDNQPAYGKNFCEAWQETGSWTQTITGLSKGIYKVTVNGFERRTNNAKSYELGEQGYNLVSSNMVANGEQVRFASWYDAVEKNGDSYNPNNTGQAVAKFEDGKYLNELFVYVGDDGKLTITINKPNYIGDCWTLFNNFTLSYYASEGDLKPYQDAWEEAVRAAEQAIADNPNVTGEELTAVKTAKADTPAENAESYTQKTNALNNATAALIAAAASYNAYAAEKAIAEKIGAEVGEAPTTAAEAAAKVNELKVAEFNYVNDEYPYDYAPVIGDFGTWTGTATVNGSQADPRYLTGEHWSGDNQRAYYEQAEAGWGSNAWTVQYEKTAKLPAGDYILKVAARSSGDVTSTVSCSATDFVVALPNAGNATKGIDKSGNANFGEGEFAHAGNNPDGGYGWEWRFLPFSLTEETEVTMTFYGETNKYNNWMSIADGTLLSKQEIINDVLLLSTDSEVIEATVASTVTTDRILLSGLNTIILPFDVTAEEIGATTVLQYTGTVTEDEVTTLFFKEVAPVDGKITLQPNVPYAVFVDADQDAPLSFGKKNITPAEDLTTEDANGLFDFVGTYIDLVKGNNVVVRGDMVAGDKEFKKAKGGNRLAAYRAYMKKMSDAEPANIAFNFNGEIVTGIEAVEILNRMSDGIYNINGQKVSRTQKGIYIINGHKVIVK